MGRGFKDKEKWPKWKSVSAQVPKNNLDKAMFKIQAQYVN